MRKEMLKSQLRQLRESLGSGRPPVVRTPLLGMYNEKNYAGMVKFVRESMSLDIKIRLGLSNRGLRHPRTCRAWFRVRRGVV
jgi:hypothetical protein